MKKPRIPSPSTPTKRRRAIQYGLVFLGCVLIVDSLVGDKGLFAMLRARGEYRRLEASLAQARTTNALMREDARRLREDLTAIEDVAREDLGYIKDGEKVFTVRDVPPAALPSN